MAIRRILASISGGSDSGAVASTAFKLAKATDGHVVGCYVRQGVPPYIYFGGIGGNIGMYSGQVAESLIAHNDRTEALAANAFANAREKHAVPSATKKPPETAPSAEWVGDVGGAGAFSTMARLAETVVVTRPTDETGFDSIAVFEAGLLRAKRPMLVVPDALADAPWNSIAIAFNGSGEGARAVTAALPLLRWANHVHILTADAPADEDEGIGAKDLETYLDWHGVKSKRHLAEIKEDTAGDTLLMLADRVGAKLIVMGAYTHSHLREMVMGGVTRHLLEKTKVPLFMVH
ncbi:MAG: universal stress protein [Alphaproteobacteria bacterium]|nr:universal stress protein [Alphaproteobacteria bacterium]